VNIILLNEMANSVDFYRQKQKQKIFRTTGASEFSIDFFRDGNTLLYGFNGFGDLMGVYVYLRSEKYILAENRIGIFDEVALYIKNPLEKDFQIVISKNPEPRDKY